jgi:Kelch motif protein
MSRLSLLPIVFLAVALTACSPLAQPSGAFLSAAPAPAPAAAPTTLTALLPDGRVAAAGSYGIALYDPTSNRWQSPMALPGGGFPTGLVVLRDGSLFLVRTFQDGPDQRALLFNPADGRFTRTRPMLEARSNPSLTLLEDGRVLVTGGFGGGGPGAPLTGAEVYDPQSDAWSSVAPMTHHRFLPATALLKDGRVLFAGGDENGSGVLPAEIYDPRVNQWTAAGSLDFQAPRPLMVTLRDGRVLLVVGFTFFQGPNPAAEVYDPRTNSWAPAPDAPSPGGGSITLLGDGRAFLLKVALTRDAALFRAEIFDPATWSWSASPVMTGRADSAVAIHDGRILVVGEGGGWIYDPKASPPPPPGQEAFGSPSLSLVLAAVAAALALLVLAQYLIARLYERRRLKPVERPEH